jgi:hypothetical protein
MVHNRQDLRHTQGDKREVSTKMPNPHTRSWAEICSCALAQTCTISRETLPLLLWYWLCHFTSCASPNKSQLTLGKHQGHSAMLKKHPSISKHTQHFLNNSDWDNGNWVGGVPTHQAHRQRGSPTCQAMAGSHEAGESSVTGPGR